MKEPREVIRALREDNDLTQEYVATNVLRTTQQHYSSYERGETALPLQMIIILADYYKVSTDYIMGRTASTQGIEALNEAVSDEYTAGHLLTDVLSLKEPGRLSVIEYVQLQKLKQKNEGK